MKKKKVLNIIEIILQIFAIVNLFFPDVMRNAVTDTPYSYFEYAITGSTMSVVICALIILLFVVNIILCIKSLAKKEQEKKDSLWHVTLPIFNLVALFVSMAFLDNGSSSYMFTDVPVWSTFGYLLLFVLIVIIFVSFMKRSGSGTSKEEPINVINNIQQTATNADELKKYKDLLDSGAITQEEFDAKKKELLGL